MTETKEKKKRKPLKPLTALIPLNLDCHFQKWKDKGHTIIHMENLHESQVHEFDIIIHPGCYRLLTDERWLKIDKQLDVIEKSARAVKYKSKVKQ